MAAHVCEWLLEVSWALVHPDEPGRPAAAAAAAAGGGGEAPGGECTGGRGCGGRGSGRVAGDGRRGGALPLLRGEGGADKAVGLLRAVGQVGRCGSAGGRAVERGRARERAPRRALGGVRLRLNTRCRSSAGG